MKRMILTMALVMLIAVSASGCSGAASRAPSMAVEEYPLFQGDTKILEPHLGLVGGAVKAIVNGKGKAIYTKYEIYENGKLTSSGNAVSGHVDSGVQNYVSVSIKDSVTNDNSFELIFSIQDSNGRVASSLHIPRYDKSYSTSYAGFKDKATLKDKATFKEGEEATIFTLKAFDDHKVNNNQENNAVWELRVKTYFADDDVEPMAG